MFAPWIPLRRAISAWLTNRLTELRDLIGQPISGAIDRVTGGFKRKLLSRLSAQEIGDPFRVRPAGMRPESTRSCGNRLAVVSRFRPSSAFGPSGTQYPSTSPLPLRAA
jgi:hypothetical protein